MLIPVLALHYRRAHSSGSAHGTKTQQVTLQRQLPKVVEAFVTSIESYPVIKYICEQFMAYAMYVCDVMDLNKAYR
jgi:hypothetical protein